MAFSLVLVRLSRLLPASSSVPCCTLSLCAVCAAVVVTAHLMAFASVRLPPFAVCVGQLGRCLLGRVLAGVSLALCARAARASSPFLLSPVAYVFCVVLFCSRCCSSFPLCPFVRALLCSCSAALRRFVCSSFLLSLALLCPCRSGSTRRLPRCSSAPQQKRRRKKKK